MALFFAEHKLSVLNHHDTFASLSICDINVSIMLICISSYN